jgi:branched-chain amino acid transport system permease protein
MTTSIFLQVCIYGILMGVLYSLSAVGFTLIFGVMKVLNIAHGAFIMLGAYAGFWFFQYGINPFVCLFLVPAVFFLIGIAFYWIVVHPVSSFKDLGRRIDVSLLISIGLLFALENAALLAWTSDERSILGSSTSNVIRFFTMRIPLAGVVGFIVAILLFLALHLFLTKTRLGKSIRAVSVDYETASLMGINVRKVYIISFALATALAGLAGLQICLSQVITPYSGLFWLLKAMIIVVIAGMGNVFGVLVCGLSLGLLEAFGALIVGAPYREIIGLLILLLMLWAKPQGLFMKG